VSEKVTKNKGRRREYQWLCGSVDNTILYHVTGRWRDEGLYYSMKMFSMTYSLLRASIIDVLKVISKIYTVSLPKGEYLVIFYQMLQPT